MKAISLWQPWASAIALLLKSNETRGHLTHYRGPLAIHAAKRWQEDQKVFTHLVKEQEKRAMAALPLAFPLGAIVAVVWLEDCVTTQAALQTISWQERLWGNYGPGRYAWLLRDVVALKTPVPFSGKQGFFEVPGALLADVGGIYTPWTRATAEAMR